MLDSGDMRYMDKATTARVEGGGVDWARNSEVLAQG